MLERKKQNGDFWHRATLMEMGAAAMVLHDSLIFSAAWREEWDETFSKVYSKIALFGRPKVTKVSSSPPL